MWRQAFGRVDRCETKSIQFDVPFVGQNHVCRDVMFADGHTYLA